MKFMFYVFNFYIFINVYNRKKNIWILFLKICNLLYVRYMQFLFCVKKFCIGIKVKLIFNLWIVDIMLNCIINYSDYFGVSQVFLKILFVFIYMNRIV